MAAPSRATRREPLPTPPGAWGVAHRALRGALRPIERFLHVEAAGGMVLIVAAIVAIAWASSPWHASYEHLLETPLSLRIGSWSFDATLHFVVNELLMTLFFFVVGLEIKREIRLGELSEPRRAALPIAAAIGGMLAPATIYFALNREGPASGGWGVPMATDIAFAVGVLTLLGKRVPPALRVLLLTLAIADDVGAVLVIAVFYSSGIAIQGLVLAALAVVLTLALQTVGTRLVWLYVVPGVLAWIGLHHAGVHPTLAGVMMGLLTPASAWLGPAGAARVADGATSEISSLVAHDAALPRELAAPLRALDLASREGLSPVERLVSALHPWVAWGIMPVFALANAGVPLDFGAIDATTSPMVLGIVAGLVVGKPLGVLAGAALVVRSGLAPLPRGVTWPRLLVVGLCAGIGFTMAIFIGDLAFDRTLIAAAKLAILSASVIAGVLALAVGAFVLRPRAALEPGIAATESEAECSTLT